MSTDCPIPAGAGIRIKFRLLSKTAVSDEERSRKFELQAEVRYGYLTKERDTHRIGVRFVNISPADRNFIAGCI